MHATEVLNVQSQHLKTIQVGQNVRKWLLYLKCDKEEYRSEEKQVEGPDEPEVKDFEEEEEGTDDYKFRIPCASRGFNKYRKIWSSKLGQKLVVKREKANVFDPYSMGIYCIIKGKIEKLTLIGPLISILQILFRIWW